MRIIPLSIFRPFEKGNIYLRFNTIHRKVKLKIVYPILKFIAKHIGKYLISGSEDIPEIWLNNHLRMMFKSYEQGMDDMWLLMYKPMCFEKNPKVIKQRLKKEGFPEDPTDEQFLEYCHLSTSHKYRLLIKKIEFTEVLEDTIDRTYFDCAFLNSIHYAMKHYGVSLKERLKVPKPGEWPIYKSFKDYDKEYFLKNITRPVWKGDDL